MKLAVDFLRNMNITAPPQVQEVVATFLPKKNVKLGPTIAVADVIHLIDAFCRYYGKEIVFQSLTHQAGYPIVMVIFPLKVK